MTENEEILYRKKKWVFTLGVLSLINVGFGLLGQIQAFIIGKLSADKVEEMIETTKQTFVGKDLENQFSMFDQLFDIERINNQQFFLSHGIATVGMVVGLVGVLMMMKQRAQGFQLYIIYSIISCFGMFLYVPFDTIPMILIVTNVSFSFLMILLYHRNRTWNLEETV